MTVKGPKGELSRTLSPVMGIAVEDSVITVTRPSEAKPHKAMHGLTRTLIANMVTGVNAGYQKILELYGVGYRVQMQESRLVLQIGLSHVINFELPAGISAHVDSFVPTNENHYLSSRITLSGIDKEVLGETAAKLRRVQEARALQGQGVPVSRRSGPPQAGQGGPGEIVLTGVERT